MKSFLKRTLWSLILLPGLVVAQSNVQKFTPSVLLPQGQFEINQFNNLYSQTSIRDNRGTTVDLGQRQSFLTSTFGFYYGLPKVNIGFEVNINSAKYSSRNSSILSLLSGGGDFSRTVIGSIGPRVKFVPSSSIKGLSIQSTFLFPVASDLETPRFVAHDRYTWNTQVFLDRAINDKARIFLELAFLYRIKRNSFQQNFFRTPLSAIFSYFPTPKSTIFVSTQYAPAFGQLVSGDQEAFGQLRWFTLVGIGAKYQLTPKIGIELGYGSFILSKSDGAGSTINFGLRIIN